MATQLLHVIQVFRTSKGSIIMEFYKESAPEVVDEFIDLWLVLLYHSPFIHYPQGLLVAK